MTTAFEKLQKIVMQFYLALLYVNAYLSVVLKKLSNHLNQCFKNFNVYLNTLLCITSNSITEI